MKRMCSIIVALVMLAFGTVAVAQPTKIEYKFKKGSVDTYKLAMSIKMSAPDMPGAGPDTNVNVTGTMTQKVVDVYSDGSAKIRTTVSNVKTFMPGSKAPKAAPAKTITMVMHKNGKIKSVTDPGMGASMATGGLDINQMIGQVGAAFPDKPVSEGDKWEQVVPFPMGGGNMTVSSTLVDSDAKVGNFSALQIKQVIDGKIDLGTLIKNVTATQKGNVGTIPEISGTMDVAGSTDLFLSPNTGKLVKSVGNVTMVTNMDTSKTPESGMPSQLKMTMNMKVTVTLVK